MSNRTVALIFIALIAILVIGGFIYLKDSPTNKETTEEVSDWQAVFLSNGQVYFGKVLKTTENEITLRDIYYLQLAQAPQPENQKDQQPQVSLVKLGKELHGPVDEMRINRDHVLFVERMKSDAKVVEAIQKYEKEGPPLQVPSQNAPTLVTSPLPSSQ